MMTISRGGGVGIPWRSRARQKNNFGTENAFVEDLYKRCSRAAKVQPPKEVNSRGAGFQQQGVGQSWEAVLRHQCLVNVSFQCHRHQGCLSKSPPQHTFTRRAKLCCLKLGSCCTVLWLGVNHPPGVPIQPCAGELAFSSVFIFSKWSRYGRHPVKC